MNTNEIEEKEEKRGTGDNLKSNILEGISLNGFKNYM